MGIFDNFKRSAAKSRLIVSAGERLERGDYAVLNDIHEHIRSSPVFTDVVVSLNPSPDELEEITTNFMLSGFGARVEQHFVPASALLFPDTLAYLVRVHRGELDVSPADAFWQVHERFRRKDLIFQPSA